LELFQLDVEFDLVCGGDARRYVKLPTTIAESASERWSIHWQPKDSHGGTVAFDSFGGRLARDLTSNFRRGSGSGNICGSST
jgi:hypothetical protein